MVLVNFMRFVLLLALNLLPDLPGFARFDTFEGFSRSDGFHIFFS